LVAKVCTSSFTCDRPLLAETSLSPDMMLRGC
jgi:hypothetical protein